MNTYQILDKYGKTVLEVIADKFEIEYGAVVFYHENSETRPFLAVAPGNWVRVITLDTVKS